MMFPALLFFALLPPTLSSSTFNVSRTLGSHAVLQRAPASPPIFGLAPPGTAVNVTFLGATLSTTAGSDGSWRVFLPPTPATTKGVPIGISSPLGSVLLEDILFGEVFLCSGQSNLAFSLAANTNGTQEAAGGNSYPHIRLLTVGTGTSSETPLTDLGSLLQPWSVASNTSLINGTAVTGEFTFFSSVCYFFGRSVHDGLGGGIPVGLISSAWGVSVFAFFLLILLQLQCGRRSTPSAHPTFT